MHRQLIAANIKPTRIHNKFATVLDNASFKELMFLKYNPLQKERLSMLKSTHASNTSLRMNVETFRKSVWLRYGSELRSKNRKQRPNATTINSTSSIKLQLFTKFVDTFINTNCG
jgi:hypothetical protein